MTKADQQRLELAEEYALGVLTGRRLARAEALRATDGAFRAMVDQAARRLDGLAAALPGKAPPAGLFAAIETRVRQARPPVVARIAEGRWQKVARGVQAKILLADAAAGSRSLLLRLAPGASIPSHRHDRNEECVILSGAVEMGDSRLGAGDFMITYAGSSHPPVVAIEDTLLFIREG